MLSTMSINKISLSYTRLLMYFGYPYDILYRQINLALAIVLYQGLKNVTLMTWFYVCAGKCMHIVS